MAPTSTDQPRFTDNNDGTVTDNKTGLTWTKATIAVDVDHEKALAAAAEHGEGWRLPTTEELLSLVDRSTFSPAIDNDSFPDTKNDIYWTADPCAWSDTAVWCVGFLHGRVYSYHRLSRACVRAVRSGQ